MLQSKCWINILELHHHLMNFRQMKTKKQNQKQNEGRDPWSVLAIINWFDSCQRASSQFNQKRELFYPHRITLQSNQNPDKKTKNTRKLSIQNPYPNSSRIGGDRSVQRGCRHAKLLLQRRETCNPVCWAWIFGVFIAITSDETWATIETLTLILRRDFRRNHERRQWTKKG